MKTYGQFIQECTIILEMRKEDKVKGKQKTPMYLSKTSGSVKKTPEGKWKLEKIQHERPNPDAVMGRRRQGMTPTPGDTQYPGWGSEREQLRRHSQGGGGSGAKDGKPGELRGKKRVPGAKRERDFNTDGPSPQMKVGWAKSARANKGKNIFEFILECYELEESSTGERSRGRATLGRGRGADMTSNERSIASISKKARLRGTGKYSTKDLRTPSQLYTNNNPDGYGDKGSTKVSHYVTTHASPRSAATSPDLEVINKKEYTGIDKDGKVKFKHHSSADSVRKAKDFKKAITRSGGDKRGKVHDVSILPDDAFREKNQNKGRMPLGRSLVKGVEDIPKHLKAAGAEEGEIVVGKPNAVLPDEDKKTGAEKRGRLYSKILGSRASKRSKKTGVMVGKV